VEVTQCRVTRITSAKEVGGTGSIIRKVLWLFETGTGIGEEGPFIKKRSHADPGEERGGALMKSGWASLYGIWCSPKGYPSFPPITCRGNAHVKAAGQTP